MTVCHPFHGNLQSHPMRFIGVVLIRVQLSADFDCRSTGLDRVLAMSFHGVRYLALGERSRRDRQLGEQVYNLFKFPALTRG